MGQIKNIKLHIVTDIKDTNINNSNKNNNNNNNNNNNKNKNSMAQGKGKLKSVHKKERSNKKALGPKKGQKLHVNPKKMKTIKEQKLKIQLTKAINNHIEDELATKAGGSGMKIVKAPPGSSDDS